MFAGMVPFLALFTLLAVAVLALISGARAKARMRDPNAPVSTLAKDGKYGGVAFLRPLDERIRDPRDPLRRHPPTAERLWDEPVVPTRY